LGGTAATDAPLGGLVCASRHPTASRSNQIIDIEAPRYVDQLQIATVTLVADGVGTVIVSWSNEQGTELNFFGLHYFGDPPFATSFTIPEPTPALLSAASLLLLVGLRRRAHR
jgi:hypothetical protein